jgi:hypothetical protein
VEEEEEEEEEGEDGMPGNTQTITSENEEELEVTVSTNAGGYEIKMELLVDKESGMAFEILPGCAAVLPCLSAADLPALCL